MTLPRCINWRTNRPNLLTVDISQAKLTKSREYGYLSSGVGLLPGKLAGGRNLCEHATSACLFCCLVTSGHARVLLPGRTDPMRTPRSPLTWNVQQQARFRRTRWLLEEPESFVDRLSVELDRFIIRAEREDLAPCCRPNLHADLPWEREHPELFDRFPSLQWYDYTKDPTRLGNTPENYHLSFSRSEKNAPAAVGALRRCFNVAIVFRSMLDRSPEFPAGWYPETWGGSNCVDGTVHDLTFLHSGKVLALRPLAKAIDDSSGFVA